MTSSKAWAHPDYGHGLVEGDGDPRHGGNGYNNLGCRCEVCRAANRLQQKTSRARRAAALKADPSIAEHGKSNTYLNYHCRCKKCRAAHALTARYARLEATP